MVASSNNARLFRLLFLGDVMLGRLMNQVLQQVEATYPWGDTLPLLLQADVCICNLECVLADTGSPWSLTPKVFHFRSDTRNVAALQEAHIKAVSLANNHTLDFGYEALLQMLAVLRRAGIHFAGAGSNSAEARQPALWETAGQKLGLLALTDNEPAWEAGPERPGIWYMPMALSDPRAAELRAALRAVRAQVDWLIVSLHWGGNWGGTPPAEHRAFAHALIDAGADIVYGHSPHVVRGIEIYRGRPVLYSCGDFVDDYAVEPRGRNDLSFIFSIEIVGSQLMRLRLYPTVIRAFQARRAHGSDREELVTTMLRLCSLLGTAARWSEREACLEIEVVRV
ncbi:capsule biosynthesis protein [Thermogemmatispora aurantia]|uniref:Capsule biosynthesis protein n=1 Tax=Thermogemmatispora aurantia TaxID=2045279 RepID=A0A5J4KG49_9CHLR|nr:CapA family protein [Thermogemmatispora aurantia]GER85271.1 capsule biosynthesis protein [Thermogemmatispora aurantia]